MSKQTAASLFILPPSEAKSAELYQALLRGVGSYQQLGNRLIQLAEHAHAFRQFDRVREYGQILSNIPIKSFQAVGYYYLAVAANSMGNGDQDKARRLFELVADTAPEAYKAKAILSLAAIATHAGDYQSQVRYSVESLKASKDVSTTVRAHLGIAIYKSMEGFHQQALKDMESLYRLARHSQPVVFFDYLNSLAVELGEVGRIQEACNVSRLVLASPFTFAYPEWRETAQELNPSRRSMVTVGAINYNLLTLPEREPSEQPASQPPARVLSFAKGKKKMAKKNKDKKIKKSVDEMNFRDLGFKLLELVTKYQADEEQMRVLVAFAMTLFEPSEPDPDKPAS